jgi:hypothetical protein
VYNHYRRRNATALLSAAALTVGLIALFSVVMTDTDDDLPRCPVSHAGSVDLVPSGVRPCALFGSGSGSASGSGYTPGYGSHTGTTPRPGSTVKQPAAKVPAAKVPAAPKQPAPKVLAPPPARRR